MTETSADLAVLPDLTLPDLDERPRALSEWSGQPVLLNFWATWCAPCRREIPLLVGLQQAQSEDGIQVVGIGLDNPDDMRRFLTMTPVNYPMLYGEDKGSVYAEALGDAFIGLPFSAVAGPGGDILMLHSGELTAIELERITQELDALLSGARSVTEVRQRLTME